MGCCLDCCPNAQPKILAILLLVFIFIIFVTSIIAACYRIGPNDRYKNALILLDKRNDGSIFKSFPHGCFKGFTDEEKREIWPYSRIDRIDEETACIFDQPQSKEIYDQNLFKIWKGLELPLHIIRILITGAYFAYLLFILLKYLNKSHNGTEPNFCTKYFMIIVLSMILILYSIMFLVLISNVVGTNQEIGLYKSSGDDDYNDLENSYFVNIIISLVNICI